MSISVIIPTLNAGDQLKALLDALKKQTVKPDEILVVDSQSEDHTCLLAEQSGAKVVLVKREEFDHGRTRDMALRMAAGDMIVFMTQDALPVNDCFLANLIAPLADAEVAAVGGRQVARKDARPFERLVRMHNYPAVNRKWSAQDIGTLGVRAFLISDVCAVYRRESYLAVGGFDYPILTNEDMLMAERLLHAGYKLAYSGDAAVYHSHHFTLAQEYRRNLIIGKTMKRYEKRFEHVGELGTGVKLVKDVLRDLIREGHFIECFSFAANCAARLLGNRVGRYQEERRMARRERETCV